jgi:hypothetical protein
MKKKRPAVAGRRFGDAIPGGVNAWMKTENIMWSKRARKDGLTIRGGMAFIGDTSLLFVSTAGREAGSSESAFAFEKGAPRLE